MLQPGVTDPVGDHAACVARDLGIPVVAVATGHRFEVTGALDDPDMDGLIARLLVSPVVERFERPVIATPFGTASPEPVAVEVVAICDADDEALDLINRTRRLALDAAEMTVLRDHFTAEGRDPTDVELETIAQTWSEHCSHKTFRGRIELDDGTSRPSLMSRLRDTTRVIDAEFVRSAFDGNAGIVSFEGGRSLALKAETHNHPSAIEPFGGRQYRRRGSDPGHPRCPSPPHRLHRRAVFRTGRPARRRVARQCPAPPPHPVGRRGRGRRLRQQDRFADRGRGGALRPGVHRQSPRVLRLHRGGGRRSAAARDPRRRPSRRHRRPHRARRTEGGRRSRRPA